MAGRRKGPDGAFAVWLARKRITLRSPGSPRHRSLPERGVYPRRWDLKRTRIVFAPPTPGHRPHGRRENRESSFPKTQPGKRALVRHPQCFEGVIGKSPGRQKGAAAGLIVRRAKKGSPLFDAQLAPRRSPGCTQQDRSCPVGVRAAGLARGLDDCPLLGGAQSNGDKLAAIVALRNRWSSHFCHARHFM